MKGKSGIIVTGLLAALALGCALFLLLADKRWDAPGKLKALDLHIRNGLWWGAAVNLGMLITLIATARFWLTRLEVGSLPVLVPPRSFPRWFILSLIPLLALACWLRLPRLEMSFYSDETYFLRHFVHGEWRGYNPAKFREIKWKQTLWDYRRPTNHMFYSVLSRASLLAWQDLGDREGDALSATAVRLPALLAAMASLALLAVFGAQISRPGAGLLAALLAALHPWHIAHSVEARGYALVFFFSMALVCALVEVLRSGRWRWAALAAGSSFGMLYTYPGALNLDFALNAVVAATLLWACRGGRAAWIISGRLLVAHALALGAVFLLFAPCIPQLKEYLKRTAVADKPEANLIPDLLAYFTTGMPWAPWEESNPLAVSASASIWTMALTVLLLALALLAAWTMRKTPGPALLLAAVVLVPTGSYIISAYTGTYVFVWYSVYALPALLMLVALGTLGWDRRLGAMAAVLLVGLFTFATAEQRQIVRFHPKEPLKEVAAALRAHAEKEPGAVQAMLWPNARCYAPEAFVFLKLEDLRKKMAECRDSGQALYVTYGYRPTMFRHQEYRELFGDAECFEEVQSFHGSMHGNSNYYLLRWTGKMKDEATDLN